MWMVEESENKRTLKSGTHESETRPKNESEEVKKPPEEEVDKFFDEGDSDAETEPVFWESSTPLEQGAWTRGVGAYPEEDDNERRCVDLPICHKDQHRTDFKGLPILEIFKVKVKFNKIYATTPINDARLLGEIVTQPYSCLELEEDNPESITYYRVRTDKPDFVSLDCDNDFLLLPISSPVPRPPICGVNYVTLRFAFKIDDKDVFTSCGYRHDNTELFGDGGCLSEAIIVTPDRWECYHGIRGHFIKRELLGVPSPNMWDYPSCSSCDPLIMAAYISVFQGVWATIDVKMLRDDDGVDSFYGLIVARPCVFFKRFRLLTVQRGRKRKVTIERGDDGKVDEETRLIKLTRSVVAVPYYSSLIIGALLYGDDDEPLCHDKVAFAARESGEEIRRISYNGAEVLEVKVKWNCHRA